MIDLNTTKKIANFLSEKPSPSRPKDVADRAVESIIGGLGILLAQVSDSRKELAAWIREAQGQAAGLTVEELSWRMIATAGASVVLVGNLLSEQLKKE